MFVSWICIWSWDFNSFKIEVEQKYCTFYVVGLLTSNFRLLKCKPFLWFSESSGNIWLSLSVVKENKVCKEKKWHFLDWELSLEKLWKLWDINILFGGLPYLSRVWEQLYIHENVQCLIVPEWLIFALLCFAAESTDLIEYISFLYKHH